VSFEVRYAARWYRIAFPAFPQIVAAPVCRRQ
jgi:hypothetical protein